MILVIGGFGAGKKAWVKENLGYKESDFSSEIENKCPVIFDLQDTKINDENYLIEMLLKKEVVICNEIGCGIVPVVPEEREKREQVGRLLISLAGKAESVYRVYCGIGQKIK